ncbi:MAG: tRNA (adenosine(37)-N6)-threonylcarbamoyltransferase complex dimerization subunit type 1 TsaB [Chloroflexi bacterium]|nr:MAG: tRNA (adenosine(37)-N6)-threonylcarbamoyltransferase complex dimerization subunit type 1 TsaB [Chloroflexota bacterium]RLC96162.1 MAG: tRNA (adenosine(37)-N6)-threonylcarbamoyltransferase complex dimerization subunit type 1 TsaB [Chloroflexota bacterium]
MMILSIDTAGRSDAIGLIDGRRVLADFVGDVTHNSLQGIIMNIDAVLSNAGLTLADVDGLGVGIGPGSWTGVRVGITVGKMMAYATGKPLCGVSSLDALASQAGDASTLICSVVDAGRGNIYAGFYRRRGGVTVKQGQYTAGPVEGLVARIREPVLFVGDAAQVHRQTISALLGDLARFMKAGEERQGSATALLALSRLERGESDDALSLVPLYLKEPLVQALAARKR